MFARRSCTVSRVRFRWLLWLALLLPVAQAAATWHAMSHLGAQRGGEAAANLALHLTHCDLCLTASALGGGAPGSEPKAMPHPVVCHEVPRAGVGDTWCAPSFQAYRSRAPPSA